MPVVEGPLRDRLVDREDRVAEPSGGAQPADAHQPGGGLLQASEDARGGTVGVQRGQEVGAVVEGDLRVAGGQRRHVAGDRVGALASDRADLDAPGHQRGRHVVLRGQRVGRAQAHAGAAFGQRGDEVRGLGRDVQAGRDTHALQRPLGGEAAADRAQHRHLALRPGDARLPRRREGEVGDVVRREVGGRRAQ